MTYEYMSNGNPFQALFREMNGEKVAFDWNKL
jgi:hypothetical protein